MPSELPATMTKIKEKFGDPEVQQSLKGFTRTMEFSLTDLKENFLFTIEDGKLVNLERKTSPESNIVITVSNSVMEDIMNKSSNPISAYISGKLKARGSMEDLMRFQKLMG